jgi:hypothetical protein
VGLAAVAAVVAVVYFGNTGSHLAVKGTILHVRTLALGDGASMAIVDFRLKNTSTVPFVVNDVVLTMEPMSGEAATGSPISKPDMAMMFQAHPNLGPKFNNILSLRDTIKGGETSDWMAAARFELPSTALDKRKTIRVHLLDVDGTVTEFTEMP